MNFLKCYRQFPDRKPIQLIKVALLQRPTHARRMAEVIDLVSSDDEVVEASAVIAGNFEARLSTSSNVSRAVRAVYF